ncbi:Pr6Pr family membrane protein [Anoxynatronum sibiricum]|uniref:Pr6Pr family membrane protein n=1 Tax=Anoxynatronum sibiricum TaxID=210623 RepID=A0ABU9VWL4_9CLOT
MSSKRLFSGCKYCRMAYGLIGLVALLLNYLFMLNGVHHDFGPLQGGYRLMRLFTNQTNLLVVAWSLYSCLKTPERREGLHLPKGLRGGLAVYITLTMAVFHVYLRQGYFLTPPLFAVSLVAHYLVPLAYLTDWLLTESRGYYRWHFLTYWSLYPLGYGLVTMVVGSLTGEYPYPFLNWQEQGVGPVLLQSAGVLLAVLLLGVVAIVLNQKLLRQGARES